VILVSTGTNGKPFDRLLRAVSRLELDEELVLQLGPSSIRPAGARCFVSARFSEFSELITQARVVVTHGGVGSVLVALSSGKRPLVVPRLARYGEAVDDHQLDFARKLDAAGLVTLVAEPDSLGPMLERSKGRENRRDHLAASVQPNGLAADLGEYLRAVVANGARSNGRNERRGLLGADEMPDR
jgi:UDP-N-acetylglucosamine transferase subunit ALG13